MTAFFILILFWLINSIAYCIATLIQSALLVLVIFFIVGVVMAFGWIKDRVS